MQQTYSSRSIDVAVFKPVKDFLKKKFVSWYANEVGKQLQGVEDLSSANIEPVNIFFAAIKVLSAHG